MKIKNIVILCSALACFSNVSFAHHQPADAVQCKDDDAAKEDEAAAKKKAREERRAEREAARKDKDSKTKKERPARTSVKS